MCYKSKDKAKDKAKGKAKDKAVREGSERKCEKIYEVKSMLLVVCAGPKSE